MAAKMKSLDKSVNSTPSSSSAVKPHKDINTFQNNQLKFMSAPTSIPPQQRKCNDLKAVGNERPKRGSKRCSCLRHSKATDYTAYCITKTCHTPCSVFFTVDSFQEIHPIHLFYIFFTTSLAQAGVIRVQKNCSV